jgi:hypothetical protein
MLKIRESLDPGRLKSPGRLASHTSCTLLEWLGDARLRTTEWREIAQKEFGVSKSRLFTFIKRLVDEKKAAKSLVDEKWRQSRTSPNIETTTKINDDGPGLESPKSPILPFGTSSPESPLILKGFGTSSSRPPSVSDVIRTEHPKSNVKPSLEVLRKAVCSVADDVRIRDARPYRGEFESFEAYCRTRWQVSPIVCLPADLCSSTTYESVDKLSTDSAEPRIPAQTPSRLSPEQAHAAQAAWEQAVQEKGGSLYFSISLDTLRGSFIFGQEMKTDPRLDEGMPPRPCGARQAAINVDQ